MEQPVPSFKSFVRGVAPVPSPQQQRPLPPPPIPVEKIKKPVRSSSIYSTFPNGARASKWQRKRSSIPEFYLQPLSLNHSDGTVSRPRSLDGELYSSPPLSPNAFYFTPQKASKTKPPLLLEAKTYIPPPIPRRKPSISPISPHRSSIRTSQTLTPPLPPIITPHTEALYNMTAEAMAISPVSSISFAFTEDEALDQSPLFLPYEHMDYGFDRAPSSYEVSDLGYGNETRDIHDGLEVTQQRIRNLVPVVDRASALSSHAIVELDKSVSPMTTTAPPSGRSSRLLSLVLDMYASNWTSASEEEWAEREREFAGEYLAGYQDHDSDEDGPLSPLPLSPQRKNSNGMTSIPKALFSEPPTPPAKSPLRAQKPSISASRQQQTEDLHFESSLRHQFNHGHTPKHSISNPLSAHPPSPIVDMAPHRMQSRDLSNYERIFPNMGRSASTENGKREAPKIPRHNSLPRAPPPSRASPFRSSPMRSSPARSSPSRSSPSRAAKHPSAKKGANTLESLLSFGRAASKEQEEPEGFNYNRPLVRRPKQPQPQESEGRAGLLELVDAIKGKPMPAEKHDPFGIYSMPEDPVAPAPAEKRGRRFGVGVGGKMRSKSQKRRDDLKKKIGGPVSGGVDRLDFAL